ncbi:MULTISPECIES: TetR/AcrR family transcriptional regulator [Aquimarina]|uniref:TetR/AcrR family transcriptional regulator n=1 Tax=Aquimarina algiphila TaxID=2047982 RepID=A0A554VBU4_9FLAO|nr:MULTISPECIES: TetR/AcrR family transcriptional regulator [Aquimarina]TSE04064.1 TetR/AcrR family transcriptional regulator [Aquimarina algiphila]
MPKIKTSKEEVLQKVIPILRTRGVQNSSMSELSKACGIQKSHFYYYFSNKEELIKEVLALVHSYFNYNFFKIIQSDTLDIQEKITKTKGLMNKIFKVSEGGCIMANTALETIHLDPIYKKEIRLFFHDFISGLQYLLEINHEPDNALTLAEQIVQDIEGGILLMQVYDDSKYLNNAIIRMEKLILNK